MVARSFSSPPLRRKAEGVTPEERADTEFSWLGKWSDIGWSVRIEPRLTSEQWSVYGRRADECWDEALRNYSPTKSLELLHALFPTHQLRLVWPRCGYRTVHSARTPGGKALIVVCGAQAQHTDTHLRDVHDTTVAIARCTQHKGML